MASNKNPPTGSFPGYQLGVQLFSNWSNAMLEHANIWDGVWSKLRSGDYEMKDWYQAVARSVNVTSATIEDALRVVVGPSAPPWVRLPSATEECPVKVRFRNDGKSQPKLSKLALLGAASQTALVGTARWDDDDDGIVLVSYTHQAEAEEGEYIGFVFLDPHPEPLAVVTVSVSKGAGSSDKSG